MDRAEEERRTYEALYARYGGGAITAGSPILAAMARAMVNRRMGLKDEVAGSMSWSQKLAAYVLIGWWKEKGMDLIAQVVANVFKQKGWQTSLLGVALLSIAAYVQFYCATDAKTGGWIDPQCAYYVKAALWAGGIGHALAPGFTAAINRPG